MDKQRLAAFADGELSPEEAAAVVMHLADHPGDQAFVDDLMASNALLARAFAGPAEEPVPERFRALVLPDEKPERSAGIVPFRGRLRRVLPALAGLGGAVAAALVGVAVLMPSGNGALRLAAGPVPAGSALHDILASRPSGVSVPFGSGELTILSSMPAHDGYCREIELMDRQKTTVSLALACKAGADWAVDVALTETLAPAAGGEGFAPAAGDDGAALERWLAARGAGAALGPEEEAEAIAKDWRP